MFGGQMVGQAIIAASATQPTKRVKSVQTVFSRGVLIDEDFDIVGDSVHEGRNLGTVAVRFVQRDRVAATMLVLMETPESDLVSHQVPKPPDVVPPDSARAVEHPLAAPETIIVDDVDISDPNQIGPPTLQLWVRFADAPADDPAMSRALLSHATDGWLIGTAMRPHEGVGQSMAHVSISTGVVSHALSFHGELDAREWLLIDHEAMFTGGGRAYGRGQVFTCDGLLVASFVQEALLRHFPEEQNPAGKSATIF